MRDIWIGYVVGAALFGSVAMICDQLGAPVSWAMFILAGVTPLAIVIADRISFRKD